MPHLTDKKIRLERLTKWRKSVEDCGYTTTDIPAKPENYHLLYRISERVTNEEANRRRDEWFEWYCEQEAKKKTKQHLAPEGPASWWEWW